MSKDVKEFMENLIGAVLLFVATIGVLLIIMALA